ncbi:MAG: RNA methyltransferase [Anaerolineaceae bacterium]|nr:RNA methyltransferase [Anaerolineaceae bacterium]
MPEPEFQSTIRQCQNPECNLRYPVTEIKFDRETCPGCGFPASVSASFPKFSTSNSEIFNSGKQLEVVLENLRSAFNVGSIFRTSDGAGIVSQLHLCGITSTPNNARMKKTSLGAENSVPWKYHPNALTLCKQLKNNGKTFCAVETTQRAKSIYTFSEEFFLSNDIVLIFGNEVAGVDPDILALCPYHIEIPMQGIKVSLNVAIAASIILYHAYFLQTVKELVK